MSRLTYFKGVLQPLSGILEDGDKSILILFIFEFSLP